MRCHIVVEKRGLLLNFKQEYVLQAEYFGIVMFENFKKIFILSKLDVQEIDLNAGRFINFNPLYFDNGVELNTNICELFDEYVSWINANTNCKWNIEINYFNKISTIFYFDDKRISTLFKLIVK